MKYVLLLAFFFSIGCTNQNKQTPDAAKAPTVAVPVTLPVAQSSPPATDKNKHSCSKGTDKRDFEIVKKDDGCFLMYTEAGKVTKKTSSSAHGPKRCEDSEKKLIAKLEKTGFQCN